MDGVRGRRRKHRRRCLGGRDQRSARASRVVQYSIPPLAESAWEGSRSMILARTGPILVRWP